MLLLIPNAAFAGLSFDISCKNISNIVITRSANQFLQQHTSDGIVHGVLFFLKPETRSEFQQFVDASRQRQRTRNAEEAHSPVALTITTHGKPLRSDILEIRGYGGSKVCTFIHLEKDAFDTARSVCPTVPIEFITPPSLLLDGQAE